MPTIDTTAASQTATRAAGGTTAAPTGIAGIFAAMMAEITASMEGASATAAVTATTAAGTATSATAKSTGTASTEDTDTATTSTQSTDDPARAVAASTDLAAALAMVAQGGTVAFADAGGLPSPATLGATQPIASSTSAARAGIDPAAESWTAPAAASGPESSAGASTTAASTTATTASTPSATTTPPATTTATAATATQALPSTSPALEAAAAEVLARAEVTAPTPRRTDGVAPTAGTVDAAATAVAGLAAGGTAAAAATASAVAAATTTTTTTATSADATRGGGSTTTTASSTAATTGADAKAVVDAADGTLGLKSFVARRVAPTRSDGAAHQPFAVGSTGTGTAATRRGDEPTAAASEASSTAAPTGRAPLAAKTADATPATPASEARDVRTDAATVATAATTVAAAKTDRDDDASADGASSLDPVPHPPRTGELVGADRRESDRVAGQTAATTATLHPATLAAAAETIARRSERGSSRFSVRLDPAELGSIDVRVEVGSGGAVKAHLVVERAETLDMMLRDQKSLERSLAQAGLDVGSSGLQFSLRGGDTGGGNDRGSNGSTPGEIAALDETPSVPQDIAVAAYRPTRIGGLDLRV